MTVNQFTRKQIKALKSGIESLLKQRRPFKAGYLAYKQQGIRPDPIDSDVVSGIGWGWMKYWKL